MLHFLYTNHHTCFVNRFCNLDNPLYTSNEEMKSWLAQALQQSLKTQLIHHQTDTLEEQLLKIPLLGPKKQGS
jgi:hypothetical protein